MRWLWRGVWSSEREPRASEDRKWSTPLHTAGSVNHKRFRIPFILNKNKHKTPLVYLVLLVRGGVVGVGVAQTRDDDFGAGERIARLQFLNETMIIFNLIIKTVDMIFLFYLSDGLSDPSSRHGAKNKTHNSSYRIENRLDLFQTLLKKHFVRLTWPRLAWPPGQRIRWWWSERPLSQGATEEASSSANKTPNVTPRSTNQLNKRGKVGLTSPVLKRMGLGSWHSWISLAGGPRIRSRIPSQKGSPSVAPEWDRAPDRSSILCDQTRYAKLFK